MQNFQVMLRVLLVIVFMSPLGSMAQTGKPNIVLVLMDNFGWGELGTYGGGILRGAPTPRIDALAEEGMKLLNFNVEAQCTPSRAALLTGRYAVRTGNASVPGRRGGLWVDAMGIYPGRDVIRCRL